MLPIKSRRAWRVETTRGVQLASKRLWQVNYVIKRKWEDVKNDEKEPGELTVGLKRFDLVEQNVRSLSRSMDKAAIPQ